MESFLVKNQSHGLEVIGEEARVVVKRCKVKFNLKSGVVFGVGIKGYCVRNDFAFNGTGVRLISCQSKVLNNSIRTSKKDGVSSKSVFGLLNNSEIKLNIIINNSRNGVKISGKENRTLVQSNLQIQKNHLAGVLVCLSSEAKITLNNIFKNRTQGVLIKDSSSAYLLNNSLFQNIKANLAIGGRGSSETVVISNNIYDSCGPGIYLSQALMSKIYYNKIYQNYQGIVLLGSRVDLSFNSIFSNHTNGIDLMQASHTKIHQNKIIGNEAAGVFVEEGSFPDLYRNLLKENQIDFVSQEQEVDQEELSNKRNQITTADFERQKMCQIF